MIPRRIFTAWVGQKPKPVYEFSDSWKLLSDFEIIELGNDDIVYDTFVEQMILDNQWGAVADYMRMYYVYHIGGIMMDLDFEILKPIDDMILRCPFISEECQKHYDEGRSLKLNPAISGAERHDPFFREMLEYFDMCTSHVTSPDIATRVYQEMSGIRIFANEVFMPEIPDEYSYMVHHFKGEWAK